MIEIGHYLEVLQYTFIPSLSCSKTQKLIKVHLLSDWYVCVFWCW